MSPFKKAQQVVIPDSMLDTESWVSDETLARVFFGVSDFKTEEFETVELPAVDEDELVSFCADSSSTRYDYQLTFDLRGFFGEDSLEDAA